MSRAGALRTGLLGALVLAGSACSFVMDASPGATNRCTASTDCRGSVCDVARGICVAPGGGPALRIGLEIAVPSAAGTSASVSAVAPFVVDATHPLDLRSCASAGSSVCIPETVMVTGWLRRADGTPVDADVVFVPASVIPGRNAPTVTVSAHDASVALGGVDYDYIADLAGGVRYDVLVRPRGADADTLPPMRLPAPVEAPASGTLVVSLTYPELLATQSGVLIDAAYLPLAGVTVQAIDPDHGGAVVSTTALSGDDTAPDGPGSFTLVLSPNTTRYVLRVGGVTLPGEAPSPAYDVDPMYLFPDALGRAQVLVPQLRTIVYEGSVNVEGDALARVEGATVEFRASELLDVRTGATGVYRTTPVTTGADGSFQALLVPGTYEVVVRPPSTETAAELGVYATSLTISDTTPDVLAGQAFELPPRFTYGGSVTTADGRHIAGASVQASARGVDPTGGLELAMRFNRTSTTSSDDTGAFTMPLDRGLYDLAVKPPMGSGFPWVIVRDVEIHSTIGSFVREVVFDAPVALGGTLIGAHEQPIEGAEIRAYALIDVPDLGQRSVEVARATSAADGSYELLLPARLE